MAVGPGRQPLGLGQARVQNGSARFSGIILKTGNGFKLVNFITFEPQVQKLQIICQNAQQGNLYLLVPLLELIDQNNLPLFNKNINGRINVEFGKSIT